MTTTVKKMCSLLLCCLMLYGCVTPIPVYKINKSNTSKTFILDIFERSTASDGNVVLPHDGQRIHCVVGHRQASHLHIYKYCWFYFLFFISCKPFSSVFFFRLSVIECNMSAGLLSWPQRCGSSCAAEKRWHIQTCKAAAVTASVTIFCFDLCESNNATCNQIRVTIQYYTVLVSNR